MGKHEWKEKEKNNMNVKKVRKEWKVWMREGKKLKERRETWDKQYRKVRKYGWKEEKKTNNGCKNVRKENVNARSKKRKIEVR